jgi:transcription initiation factor TFIID subunit 7
MNDRLPIRDRTLILRILVPGLETRLRDKMKETANQASKKESILDLDGVTCEPSTARNNTLWSFHCDGATYPAKLVNLPCPVEIQKTLDHASFYKCSDVAQMLIVYEDEMALEEADERPVEGYPSYYHSGLTPPMKKVVERRFAAREHSSVAPPRAVVQDVENVIIKLMEELANNEKTSNKRNKAPVLTTANKDFVEIEEEIVYYEPWMGDQSGGVEFEAGDPQSQYSLHPEVWLSAETIQKIREEEEEEANKKKQKAQSKATAKKQNKPSKEKDKKKAVNRTEIVETDQVTDAALAMMNNGGEIDLEGDDLFEDFDFDTNEMEAIDMDL